ncbi:pyridoxamine 5'-phosphate oxidase family protein [Cellulomonas fimi]|uniref:Pyridoxamine 5'-phosphate oxidase-related FMN-binding protein n=1 Tax=Cellulomonas fimi (strain ATCC 484 / DSM 20113 / JCM 1341 / CCUG 24087 / LMG 16345 / NBRC 15513 / NCIMB 8980 / NCTC 7547 / NRS-133) TaxID=590998 RepID=F4H6Y4_CELFA|nr:pyridoxamine 5'-phosphate oxidase family protein [Cellulomonas fimi]AEE44493.1 pyridoxamine 5'-phosphate oxidase-related FMN-binding protein [Cellulomonas fimi ATCC 484]NNH06608.1 pyridoxamine 5'-phosphate oxidase family protein [Cellulomonas fimi]VEH26471.1 PPOX class probable F420-dependent enzyme [Cellulomonas fimi]
MTEPRSTARRVADTRHRLETDVDLWVATADPATGEPFLVPLSFLWDGETLLLSTPASSRTARNLLATGRARLGVGATRDVVLVDADVEVVDALPTDVGDAFATATGFDPRTLTGYAWFRARPRTVQAWREADELEGRTVLRDGRWVLEA